MPVIPFRESDRERVSELSDATFASMDLSRFEWQPCRQVESLAQQGVKFVFEDEEVKDLTVWLK